MYPPKLLLAKKGRILVNNKKHTGTYQAKDVIILFVHTTSPMISVIQCFKKYIILHFHVCCKQKLDRSDSNRTRKTNRKQRGESTTKQSTTKQLMPSGLWFFITAVVHIYTPPSPASLCAGHQQYFNVILSWDEHKVEYVALGLDRLANDRQSRQKQTGVMFRSWSVEFTNCTRSTIWHLQGLCCVLCSHWLSHTSSCCKKLDEQKPLRH